MWAMRLNRFHRELEIASIRDTSYSPDTICLHTRASRLRQSRRVLRGAGHGFWLHPGGHQSRSVAGIEDVKNEHLVDRIDSIETIDVRDRAENISTFADNGYDVIITVGSSISDETITAA